MHERHCAEKASASLDRTIWADLGGCPRNWKEAAALYRRLGVRNLFEATCKVMGPPVRPRQAMRGDVVMIDGALCICRGEWAECLDRMEPMSKASAAWRP